MPSLLAEAGIVDAHRPHPARISLDTLSAEQLRLTPSQRDVSSQMARHVVMANLDSGRRRLQGARKLPRPFGRGFASHTQ